MCGEKNAKLTRKQKLFWYIASNVGVSKREEKRTKENEANVGSADSGANAADYTLKQ